MFCRLTYSCIQFIQRMIPPLSIIYKTKPNGLSLLYKNSGQMSTKSFIKKKKNKNRISDCVFRIHCEYLFIKKFNKRRYIQIFFKSIFNYILVFIIYTFFLNTKIIF